MPLDPLRLVLGTVFAAAIAALAWRRRSLSRDGAVAATVVGAVVVGAGGWWWGVLLVAFFASSSALSKAGRRTAGGVISARGAERDAIQVAANGGVAALIALLAPFAPNVTAPLYAAFAGALAAATADTWATEIGARSRTPPRLLVGGGQVAPGTSGGVTPLGSAASLGGALALAALAAAGVGLGAAPGSPAPVWVAVVVAGIAGSLADSLLGATLQAAYRCPRCGLPTERRVHGCGAPSVLVRGQPAVTNDAVNGAATLVGAVAAWAVLALAS